MSENTPSEHISEANQAYQRAIRFLNSLRPLGFRLTATGTENLPTEGPFILAMSHHNAWDVPAMGCTIYKELGRPVHFVSDEEILDGTHPLLQERFGSLPKKVRNKVSRKIGRSLSAMHALPINRTGRPTHNQLRGCIETAEEGGILGIYVEGGIVYGDRIAQIEGGAGYIASKSNVIVIPAATAGRNVGKPGSVLAYWPRPLHVHFAEGISPSGRSKSDVAAFDEQLRIDLQSSLDTAREQYQLLRGGGARATAL